MKKVPQKRLAIAIVIIFLTLWALSEFGKEKNAMLSTPSTLSTGMAERGMSGEAIQSAGDIAQSSPVMDQSYGAKSLVAQDNIMSNPQSVPPSDAASRVVVKNGSISLVVKQLQPTIDRISQIAQSVNGLVINSSIYGGDPIVRPLPVEKGRPMPNADVLERVQQHTSPTQANITIRVPADQLDAIINQVRQTGLRVTSENMNAEDVTDRVIDLQARLKNLQAQETQLQRLMERATTVSDTLQVTSQLTQTRSQIESLQGQMDYFNKSAKLSQLNIILTVEEESVVKTPIKSWNPSVAFQEAVASVSNTLKDIGTGLIKLAVYSILWLPLLLIGYFLYKRFIKRNPNHPYS